MEKDERLSKIILKYREALQKKIKDREKEIAFTKRERGIKNE